jgi:NAD-dependent SIR2 family protein deacetylase
MEHSGSDTAATSNEGSVKERHCGRCQLAFPGEEGSHPTAQLGWWLCPPCKEALTGHQGRTRS